MNAQLSVCSINIMFAAVVAAGTGCVDLNEGTAAVSSAEVALTGPPPTRPVLGTQHVLALVVRDASPNLPTNAEMLATAQSDIDGFKAFMARSSYDRVSYAFDVRGVIDLGDVCAANSDATQRALLAGAVAAVDAQVDFSMIHQIVVFGFAACSFPLGSSGQQRQVWSITTGEGPLDSSVAWANNVAGEVGFGTLLHELSHTLGGAHLEPKRCIVNGLRVPIVHGGTSSASCQLSAPWMLAHEPLGFTVEREYAMPRKLFWGWVSGAEIITPAATNTFVISATEATGPAVRAIRIPLPDSATYGAYVLEYRDGTGVDLGQTPGLYLYADRMWANSSRPDLIEPPPFAHPDAFTARPLVVGERYDDPTYPIGITLQATAGDKALVRVDLAGTCTPGSTTSCCYDPRYPCDGAITCDDSGQWGTCRACGEDGVWQGTGCDVSM